MRRSRTIGAPIGWPGTGAPGASLRPVPVSTTNPLRAASIDVVAWKRAMTLEHTLARGIGHDISGAWTPRV